MRTFSCDIETDGIDANVVWCISVHDIDTDEVTTFAGTCLDLFKSWVETEADCLIFHNGISFDVPVFKTRLLVNVLMGLWSAYSITMRAITGRHRLAIFNTIEPVT